MKLLKCDMEQVLRRLPIEVRNLMQNEGLILAGGFIRAVVSRETPSDIDLFGSSLEQLREWADGIARLWKGRVHETDNALTVITPHRPVIQFITRWTFTDPRTCLDSFDFTIAQAAIYWWEDKNLGITGHFSGICSDRFYPDLASKRLWYTSPVREEEAGGSMMRVRKFLGKGYHIEAESFGKVIARIVDKVDTSRVAPSFEDGDNNLPKRLTTAECVIGLLREVDPLHIVNGMPVEEE